MVSLIAGTASFFVVGLGQALKGEFGKGLKFFLAFVTLGLLRIAVSLQLGGSSQMLLVTLVIGLVMALIYFVQLVDAFGVIDAADHVPYL